jgi:hypothetical protein
MNENLTLSAGWYVRLRQRQLHHKNLWSLNEWRSELVSAGFSDVKASRYLDPSCCRFWDVLDLPAGWGVGRYRLGLVLRRLTDTLLPSPMRSAGNRWLSRRLAARIETASRGADNGCAALLVARKGIVPAGAAEAA